MLRPLLEVEMSKKCTPLWREAHFQVKMYKVHAVVARSTFPSQKCQKLRGSDHFWTFRCRQRQRQRQRQQQQQQQQQQLLLLLQQQQQLLLLLLLRRYNCATLHYTKRHYTNYNYNHNIYHNYNYATLHYATQDYTALHYPTLHYTRPITPLQHDCNYTTLITLHHNYNSTTLQLRLQLQYTTLHPAVVGEVTTATIATTPTNTTPTTFRSISGFALPSVIHNNQPLLWSYRFPILKLPPPPCAVLLVSEIIRLFFGNAISLEIEFEIINHMTLQFHMLTD